MGLLRRLLCRGFDVFEQVLGTVFPPQWNPLLNLVGAGRTNQRLIEDIAIHRR